MTSLQSHACTHLGHPVYDVYLGLGSNVRRHWHLRQACLALRGLLGPLQCSQVFESPAVGLLAPPFFNVVVRVQTELSLHRLVEELKSLEAFFGRCRQPPDQVSLDIDLLLFANQIGRFGDIELPRREILERASVLRPLAQLAPALRHPLQGQTFAELWACFANKEPLSVVDLTLF